MGPTNWPATLPTDPESLRSVRDDMLSRGLLAPAPAAGSLRPMIERSWRRCIADSVPTARTELDHSDVSSMTQALRDAAAPVVDRMSEHLGGLRVGLFVSNDRGQILLRKAEEHGHRRVLDNASAAEGFDFSEVSVGTNGMGTVLVERQPVLVHGAEHFSDLLEEVTCAATPIFEPFTRRLLGTFSIACASRDASPLMYGLTTDVGRQIESNLTTMMSAREQSLIRAYLMAENSSRDPVLVLTERTVFANTVGVPHLDSTSHALLWRHLEQLDPAVLTGPVRLPVSGGWRLGLVEAVDGARGQQRAWCVRLLPAGPAPDALPERRPLRSAGPSRPASPIAAHGAPTTGDDEVDALVDDRRTLVIDGGPGTGKLTRALGLLGADSLVLDVSSFRTGRGTEWADRVHDALGTGRGVVLQHLEDLHAQDVNRVRALARTAAARSSLRLVLTVDRDAAPDHVGLLVSAIAPVLRVPGLAEDPTRIAGLVQELLERAALPGQRPQLSSDALQCLLRWSWPGNVAELRSLVDDLVRRSPGRPISQADLPPRLQQATPARSVSLMESAERQAIVSALQSCGGNRSRAADLLGIGRTTLYRKMQQMRIGS
ncbi:GAF domain-containing protein [Klenkia taihuensis]|uniref:GAF domain-containing protein n=1 Tax=Klenkia taihuensis TaxID=1225127 RepID=A0A1I1U0S9_9ACTN|nr:GAF domain-containing protein [Klenkia taihuensis]